MQLETFGIFGEVLFDCFADGVQILGGAPFNVAWHLQAFELEPVFISRVGQDASGNNIRAAMLNWGMSGQALQTDCQYPTGSVAIDIIAGEPHYDILDQQAYDFIDPAQLPNLDCHLLYHGSLALRHPTSLSALESLKSRHRGKIFMDVNLRTPWWDRDRLATWLADADWVKLNDHELQQLLPGTISLENRMSRFMNLYSLEGLVLTRGSQGATAMTAAGEWITVTPENSVAVVDTVGAGDAFAAILLIGLHKNWPLRLTMERAQNFASALVGQRGATVQDFGFYQRFTQDWEDKSTHGNTS